MSTWTKTEAGTIIDTTSGVTVYQLRLPNGRFVEICNDPLSAFGSDVSFADSEDSLSGLTVVTMMRLDRAMRAGDADAAVQACRTGFRIAAQAG